VPRVLYGAHNEVSRKISNVLSFLKIRSSDSGLYTMYLCSGRRLSEPSMHAPAWCSTDAAIPGRIRRCKKPFKRVLRCTIYITSICVDQFEISVRVGRKRPGPRPELSILCTRTRHSQLEALLHMFATYL
jgi:hypothetical protein